MDETRKTIYFVGAAVVLAVLAFVMAPKRITPDAFLEQGEAFFADFIDPNSATTLEVVSFNEETGSANPFKVTFKGGSWTIPSHHDYPADGRERLAKTAAGMIDIKKDDLRSNNVADHEACGVIDPLDKTAGLTGRGQRVTIRGNSDQVLADLIVGKPVPLRDKMRFVRLPDQKRVYSVRIDIDISTRFEDWIETDLMQVMKHRINHVTLKDYSINERTFSVDHRDLLMIDKDGDKWTANKTSAAQQVDSAKLEMLLSTLDSLAIVGVRPKPQGLSVSLSREEGTEGLSRADIRSLQGKGFYMTREGELLSNEGELQFVTSDGVRYTLRFGEVVYGSGMAVTAGGESKADDKLGSAQNRYLFITTEFVDDFFPRPAKSSDLTYRKKADSLWTEEDKRSKQMQDEYEKWERDVARGREYSSNMNNRFASWYYVISSESFEKLHLTRSDLIVAKTE